jgi:hypothetical protein
VEAKNYDKRIEFDIDDFIDWERIILIIRV